MNPELKDAIYHGVLCEPYAQTLKMKLVELVEGHSTVEMDYDPALTNNLFGRMHGGAIFSLIDEAFQTACQTVGSATVALNVNINYVASPEPGARLRAEAREVSSTKRTASYDIKVKDQHDRLIAVCQAVAFRTGKPLPFLNQE
ncbi:MAG TPA: PaaI family thioesterase [Geomonas sp.]|nr:PaaI family thioesterase [Geomonas sp.]